VTAALAGTATVPAFVHRSVPSVCFLSRPPTPKPAGSIAVHAFNRQLQLSRRAPFCITPSGSGMPTSLLRRMTGRTWSLAGLGLLLAAALIAVGWLDYSITRREFSRLVRAQAAAVRDTVAAAARANRAASDDAESDLAERLLDNARLLAELDRVGRITPALLDDIAVRNRLFRLTVLGADGTREHATAPAGGPGRGQGGPGWFPGPGPGAAGEGHRAGRGGGPGGGAALGAGGPRFGGPQGLGGGPGLGAGPGTFELAERLITGGEAEALTTLHESRRATARLAAGVRRANGGAILVSIDATDVADLRRQSSLDRLLADIVGSSDEVAYIVFEQDEVRRAQGDLPPGDAPSVQAAAGAVTASAAERELVVNGRPVLDLRGPIDLGDGLADLRLGMRLDTLRQAERRTISRLAVSLTAAATLGVLAIGLVWLRRAYGTLSVEHAGAQEALRRRDRLAAMGELASTVAHEIRNPLNAIAMSARRLERECFEAGPMGAAPEPDRSEALALVQVISGEAQRINGKVQQFLEFARPPALARQETPLKPWLDDILGAVRPLAEARQVTLASGELPERDVLVDPDQLRQALDNLLRNAIEATPAGGIVHASAAWSSRELAIEVRDTGAGIAPEHLPRIFDLYFTTKAGGTGVGLAVTQQIVTAHGGRIDVESAPGQGTSMQVHVPLDITGANHA
jgi:signal transduction histidine kinase